MNQDLTFAFLYDYAKGQDSVLEALKVLLHGAEVMRGSLVYKSNALKFDKNPLSEELGACAFQLSVFPVSDSNVENQKSLLLEVWRALEQVVGSVEVLAEDHLR